jgi:hypothetical protein
MDFWDNDMFYEKVHAFGKCLWITGKMTCLKEKSVQFLGKWQVEQKSSWIWKHWWMSGKVRSFD